MSGETGLLCAYTVIGAPSDKDSMGVCMCLALSPSPCRCAGWSRRCNQAFRGIELACSDDDREGDSFKSTICTCVSLNRQDRSAGSVFEWWCCARRDALTLG